jgi:hypothetical protein
MDHLKFEGMEENLKGTSLVEYLSTDFDILNQFKTVKTRLPTITYATCIDLEILIKEMMDYETPSDLQWKETCDWVGRNAILPEPVNNLQMSTNQQVHQKIRARQMAQRNLSSQRDLSLVFETSFCLIIVNWFIYRDSQLKLL